MILMFLLGIQWMFNGVAVLVGGNTESNTARDVFDYLSIVFNCSIGFIVFIYSVGCQRFQRYRTTAKTNRMGTITTSKTTKSTKITNGNLNNNVRNRNGIHKSSEILHVRENDSR